MKIVEQFFTKVNQTLPKIRKNFWPTSDIDEQSLKNLKAQATILIKFHEGVRLKPYMDSVNKLTVGVGRNLVDVGLSEAEVEILLENDINRVITELLTAIPWFSSLDLPRQLVLVDMCFNLGLKKFMEFRKTLELIQKGEYEKAGDEMIVSKWAIQVGQRAIRLSEIMRTGKINIK